MLFTCLSLFANPFTGNKNSPSPVRGAKPSTTITESQRFLHQKLGEYIKSWEEHSTYKDFALILFFAFLYGIIHAIGPGHRKSVIFSFYLTRQSNALEPLLVAIVLAFSHGGVALILALIFKGMAGAMSVNTNDASIYLEGFSFVLLILLSFFSILHVIIDHIIKRKKKVKEYKKMRLCAILLSGIYPCPAALLVLILTFALNIIWTGIIAVFAMSFGMCLPITISGYIAWAGRKGLFYRLKNKRIAGHIGTALELLGYLFLFSFSLYVAMPFILSVIRKIIW